MSTGPGIKDTNGKPRMELLPMRALLLAAQAMAYGAEKYAERGWASVPGGRAKYLGATLRHLAKHAMGERMDEESGLPHLAMALADLMIVAELVEMGAGE